MILLKVDNLSVQQKYLYLFINETVKSVGAAEHYAVFIFTVHSMNHS